MKARHGFVYTIFAIAAVASVMMLLSIQSSYRHTSYTAEKIRSDEISYFEGGIFSDLERGAHISGRRAILTLVNAEVVTGIYNQTANDSVRDIMMTGKYNGTAAVLMENATLPNWTGAIKLLASSLGYNANLTIKETSLTQKDAFNLNMTLLAENVLRDDRISMQLKRNGSYGTAINIENIEDPFIVVESYGYGKQQIIKCESLSGSGSSGSFAWGRTYIDSGPDYSGVADKGKKILIVNSLAGKLNYNGFAAIVSENAADTPPAPYIVGATGATNVLNGALAVVQGTTLWQTNITNEPKNSCYFVAPSGPSFLDRLEGTKTLSAKYAVPGVDTGLGSFIYVPGLPEELRHGPDSYAIDYQYFA